MEVDEASHRIRDRLDTRALIVYIRDGDVVAVGIGNHRRVYSAGSLNVVIDHRSIRQGRCCRGDGTTGSGSICVIYKTAVGGPADKGRPPIVNSYAAGVWVSRAITVDEHTADVDPQRKKFADAEIPTGRRPVAIDVVVDLGAGFVPHARVVGEGQREIHTASAEGGDWRRKLEISATGALVHRAAGRSAACVSRIVERVVVVGTPTIVEPHRHRRRIRARFDLCCARVIKVRFRFCCIGALVYAGVRLFALAGGRLCFGWQITTGGGLDFKRFVVVFPTFFAPCDFDCDARSSSSALDGYLEIPCTLGGKLASLTNSRVAIAAFIARAPAIHDATHGFVILVVSHSGKVNYLPFLSLYVSWMNFYAFDLRIAISLFFLRNGSSGVRRPARRPPSATVRSPATRR